MRIRNLQLLLLLIFLFSFELSAQRRNGLIGKRNESEGSIILSLGPEYCFPDTKESPFTQNPLNNWEASVGFRQRFPGNFGYKTTISYTSITGTDGDDDNRLYSFSSKLLQFTVQGEYTYNFGGKYSHSKPNSIYIFFGSGLIRSKANLNYNPRADYKYKLEDNNQFDVSVVLPYGIGYQYSFTNSLSIGAEYNQKYTFSDYLDGFKPPYPESVCNDILQGISLTISYNLF